jgi:hypothetical protein
MPQPGQYFEGVFEREYHGRPVKTPVILCCPGDWPEIAGRIPEAERERWSTCRLGVHLVAIGPATDLAWLDALVERHDSADGVLALDRRGA